MYHSLSSVNFIKDKCDFYP